MEDVAGESVSDSTETALDDLATLAQASARVRSEPETKPVSRKRSERATKASSRREKPISRKRKATRKSTHLIIPAAIILWFPPQEATELSESSELLKVL
jgi:hypothetical protein